jgi:predicted nucleic acid-binding protein
MNIYYDTSVLAKLFLDEPDSIAIASAHSEASVTATSWITFTEMHSLLRRREREKRLSARECSQLIEQFESDWNYLGKVEASPMLLKRAAHLVGAYPLKALDAIHLASALFFQEQIDEPIVLLTADRQLETAARREKLITRI